MVKVKITVKVSGSVDKKSHASDVGRSFYCNEWEFNEGRPRCDKQCKDCKNVEKQK